MSNFMLIPAICWNSKNWVKFKLKIGNYKNIIEFLIENDIYFLSEIHIDFSQVPLILHGRGRSKNLLDYLSNNSNNITLIINFLNYWLISIVKIKYESGLNLNFNFYPSFGWQISTIHVTSWYIPPTTTTTTTLQPTTTTTTTVEPEPTTTSSPPMFLEIFGQIYNI